MNPRYEVAEDEVPLSTDGLEVEEACDDDTIRQFMAEWRRRVTRDLAQAESRRDTRDHARARPVVH